MIKSILQLFLIILAIIMICSIVIDDIYVKVVNNTAWKLCIIYLLGCISCNNIIDLIADILKRWER